MSNVENNPSGHVDAFERFRQSRPAPGIKFFSPAALLLLLFIACVGVWYYAGPRVAGRGRLGLGADRTDRFPDGLLTIVQLDVGQGDATFIHTPGGFNVLIDCGEGDMPENEHSRQYAATKYVVQPFLDMYQIYDIDLLIMTHPDSDHGGGMGDLIDWLYAHGGSVHKAITGGLAKPAQFYQKYLEAVARHNVPFQTVFDPKTGELIEYPEYGGTLIGKDPLGDPTMAFQILGPLKRIGAPQGDQSNDNSVVSRLQCGDISFISAGDAEGDEENSIVEYWGNRIHSTIMFPPHHGSKTSDEPNWLKMVQPKYISTSSHPPVYGHPAADAINSWKAFFHPLPLYLRTDLNGDVWYRTDGHRMAIRTQFEVKSLEEQWTPGKMREWAGTRRYEPNAPTMWSDCTPVPGTDDI